MKKIYLIVILIFIVSCAQAKDFKYSVKQVNKIDSKYNTTIETYPNTVSKINSMIGDFEEIKKLQLEAGKEPFNYLIDYRLLNLEAEKLLIEGQKYGDAGFTADGFGCKQRPLIIESAQLRNRSALKGFEAVELSREFVEEYPKEAEIAGISLKSALFLNAAFYQISEGARKDSSIINKFCPKNETLEIYKQRFSKPSFRERKSISEEYINNLSYEGAIKIYKKDLGFD